MTTRTRDIANRDVIEALVGAAFGGDPAMALELVQAHFDPDVLVREPPFLPWGGEHRGLDAFLALFGTLASHTYFDRFEVLDILEADPDRFLVHYRVPFRVEDSVDPVWMQICEWFTFRDGKVVSLQPFYFDHPPVASSYEA